MTGLKMSLTPNERVSVDASVLWKTSQSRLNGRDDQRHYSVNARVEMIPSRLLLLLNYRHGRDVGMRKDILWHEDDLTSDSGFVELSWHALKADADDPAIDVYFRGEYGQQRNHDKSGFDEQWSARLGMKIRWSDEVR